MSGIIEKLGITPGQDGWDEDKCAMFSALIDNTLLIEDAWQALPSGEQDEIQYFENINIIQKATGKTWEEIKELL